VKEKNVYIWMALIGIVVLFNFTPALSVRVKGLFRDIFAPVQGVTSSYVGRVRGAVGQMQEIESYRETADRIAEELFVLKDRVRSMEKVVAENAELRRTLGFASRSTRRVVPCEVIGQRDLSGWWQTIRVNKGSTAGLTIDLPVITADGLVGRTMEVSRRTTEILLITDPNCRISVRMPRVGAVGIARGSREGVSGRSPLAMLHGEHLARVEYVVKDADIRVGDEVVTSGLGEMYPGDVPVGCVRSWALDSSGLYQAAELEPVVDMRNLKYVFVVVK
tara:strand:+ start:3107 stop:3937 length:831 start_codon:yes stop_codon:yes gene_type:complete